MKTVEYLNQLEDEVQSLLNVEVFSKCDYSTYGTLIESFGEIFREVDEQRKIIEQQQFVLDVIKNWAYSEQKASVGYTKARMAIQALIKGML